MARLQDGVPASSELRDRQERIEALTRFIDWAEREAAAHGARDASICLQLARVALQGRRDSTGG